MALTTQAQKTAFKAHFQANENTIISFETGLPIAINTLSADSSSDNLQRAADWYNSQVSPAYWVWRTSVSRSNIYTTITDGGSVWNWTTYKNQSVTEQGAWVQMFMGDAMSMGQLNNRQGIASIFTGSAQANAQRDHCFAVGRRTCSNLEKLFAVAVANPPANTGNDGVVGNRGKTTNPDLLTLESTINGSDIYDALLNG